MRSGIWSVATTRIGVLIRSMKLLSPEVALYLYKSTIRPCIEYCCHIWAGAPSCYLELLGKLQKRICRTDGASLAAFLEPSSSKCSQLKSLGIFLADALQHWLNWFHFLIFEGDVLAILIDCMIFLLLFLNITRMSMSAVSFLAQLDSGILCL